MTTRKPIAAHILAALRAGERLTVLEGMRRWGTLTLSQRISELRKAGHKIVSERVRINGKTFARYYLEP